MTESTPFKVLVVENSRTTQAAMQKLLTNAGYDVASVRNGQDAISAVQSSHIDLILMDLYMPMMNGYEAAHIIRELENGAQDVPIIALTASTDSKDVTVCKNAGMNEFFLKSAGEQALLEIIDRYRDQSH